MIIFTLFVAFGKFSLENYYTFSMSMLFYQFFNESYRLNPIVEVSSPSSFSYCPLLQQRTQT